MSPTHVFATGAAGDIMDDQVRSRVPAIGGQVDGDAFSCGCGKRFTARDEYAGRRAICPRCRREFIFPVRDDGGRDEPPPPAIVSRPDEPEHDETAETPRPFRKDPVVVIGAAIPTLILTVFFGYLAGRT